MLRTTILRAARLPRATNVPSSIVASLHAVALRHALPPRVACTGAVVSANSYLTSLSRSYSTADVATAAPAAEQAGKAAHREQESVTRFADLESLGVHKNLIRSVTESMGYDTMTPVQSMTINSALSGKDMVAQAKTGTGKTLAFLIPVIQKMIAENPNLAYPSRVRARSDDIRAIVLSPTRELAEQIGEEARKLCRGTGVVVQTAVGGTRKREMLMRTRQQGCHLLVATPGRLNDILSSEYSGIDAPNLSALVLDEADRMLDVGFDQELREIVGHLPSRKQKPRQTLLFSATIPKNVISLARTFVDPTNFEFVQTIKADETPTHEKVPQHIVPVRGYENIYPTMLELFNREIQAAQATTAVGQPFKAIVFLPTTNFVQMTAMAFRKLYRTNRHLPKMFHIHSKLTQQARTVAADSFRQADSAILFSSDVTARGMDFPNVSHVIQIGVPPNREQYIHRLGRTGRADKGGQGWLIIQEDEINSARNVLADLPIKRSRSLQSADHDLGSSKESLQTPQEVAHVAEAMQQLPTDLLEETYMSFLGGASMGQSVQTTLDNLNAWVRLGWGWDEPPAISHEIARRRGMLKLRGVRIATPRGRDSRDGRGDREWQNMKEENDFEDRFGTLADRRPSQGGRGRREFQHGSRRSDEPRRQQRPKASF